MTRDRDGLQLDFMARIDGIRSFESLRARALPIRIGPRVLLVAALKDIIKSKPKRRGRRKRPLRAESERALVEQIRRLLALPPSKRTHFLRVRLPNGGTAL